MNRQNFLTARRGRRTAKCLRVSNNTTVIASGASIGMLKENTISSAPMSGIRAASTTYHPMNAEYATLITSADHHANRRPRRSPSASMSSSNAGSTDITSAGNLPYDS